ncbi:MAG: hypothetical protein MJ068_00645 [Clostridia bacterium]|nr:hypothetical protein [Clostridia bacterium]
MKILLYILYWLIQCTYGIIQTLIGFCIFIKHIKCKHEFYHGAILTYHEGDWGGVSMGPFIFVNGKRWETWVKETRVHEYGHTIQSLILGPLYFFVIGIPSMIWCNAKKFRDMRERGEKNYFDLYCESGANTLGALVTGEEKPKREHTTEEMRRRERENG